ncbi:MAG TPA: outer membrane protein [Methylomirabilota bacterium]|nr:outer membrane protein [Methylomirabilota bacterium]
MRHMLTATALVLAAVVALGSTGAVSAADVPEYVPIETPEPLPLPAGNWYLRGDIGYKIYQNPQGYYDLAGYESMFDESLDDTGVIGVGVGYRFNEYLRLDATIDYEFKSRMRGQLPCPACTGPSREGADLDAWTGLINAYADLGTYNGLTPYVGAGIGASLLRTTGVSSSSPGEYYGEDTWNFAWALMAGVGYDITENVTVDLNYRYMNLGDAKTNAPDGAPGNGSIEWNDIAAHELRVGLRYNFY